MATNNYLSLTVNQTGISALTNETLKKSAESLIKATKPLEESIKKRDSGLYQVSVALGYAKLAFDNAGKEGIDGYNNVRDFAEELFGINRSQAYQLAKTGAQFYIPALEAPALMSVTETAANLKVDENTAAKVVEKDTAFNSFLSEVPTSNLSELANIPADDIKNALINGEISAKSTQQELRAWRDKVKDTTSPKVLPQYIGHVYFMDGTNIYYDEEGAVTIPDIESRFSELDPNNPITTANIKPAIGDEEGAKRVIFYTSNTFAMAFLLPFKAKKSKKSKKSPPSGNPFAGMSKDQALAMIADMFKDQ